VYSKWGRRYPKGEIFQPYIKKVSAGDMPLLTI